MEKSPPSPQKITAQLIGAFLPAALLAALQLELFTVLGDQALGGHDIAKAIGVQPRRLLPILNVLLLSGLLRRDGHQYANGEEAAHYLVKGKPSYIGNIHEVYSDLYNAVLLTAQSIREDRPAARHDFATMSDEHLTSFFRGLHGIGVVQGRHLATKHEFDRFETLADVGGGSGNIAIGACDACSGLRAIVLDLDRVVPIAKRFIDESLSADRIRAIACDITREVPHDPYDVAVMRSFIQVLSPEQALCAIANIGKRMRPGGEIYILGYVLDDKRRTPWEAAAYDVAFINIYDAGQSYTDGEYREWLTAGGFAKIERELMPNNMSLIKACKL